MLGYLFNDAYRANQEDISDKVAAIDLSYRTAVWYLDSTAYQGSAATHAFAYFTQH